MSEQVPGLRMSEQVEDTFQERFENVQERFENV